MRTRAVEPELVTLRLPARRSGTAARAATRVRSEDRLVTLLFAGLVLGALGVLLWMGRELGFYYDEWDFILDRRGISAHT
ncbi:MAG: hypothetical protein M3O90_08125, partial [Actinomycetota bacterium]|nr:hypothetical protein [Actinomycetota bacterium]